MRSPLKNLVHLAMLEIEKRRPTSTLDYCDRGRLLPCKVSSYAACAQFARQGHSPKPQSVTEKQAHSILAPATISSLSYAAPS